jgi:hypothetical protein
MIETILISIEQSNEYDIKLIWKSNLFEPYTHNTEYSNPDSIMFIVNKIQLDRLYKINKIQKKNINSYKSLINIINENMIAYMNKGDVLWSLHNKYKKGFTIFSQQI